jgi:hypothetical protein
LRKIFIFLWLNLFFLGKILIFSGLKPYHWVKPLYLLH